MPDRDIAEMGVSLAIYTVRAYEGSLLEKKPAPRCLSCLHGSCYMQSSLMRLISTCPFDVGHEDCGRLQKDPIEVPGRNTQAIHIRQSRDWLSKEASRLLDTGKLGFDSKDEVNNGCRRKAVNTAGGQ